MFYSSLVLSILFIMQILILFLPKTIATVSVCPKCENYVFNSYLLCIFKQVCHLSNRVYTALHISSRKNAKQSSRHVKVGSCLDARFFSCRVMYKHTYASTSCVRTSMCTNTRTLAFVCTMRMCVSKGMGRVVIHMPRRWFRADTRSSPSRGCMVFPIAQLADISCGNVLVAYY